jgi:hypothetical protein
MATFRCKCGARLRDDDPDYGCLLFTRREFDVDQPSELLLGRATEVWRCHTCERLWIFWDRMGRFPVEYVRQPDDRP